MRLFKKVFAVLSIALVLFVVGCSNTKDITVEGNMDITIFKTSITIDSTYTDCEDGLLASAKIKINVKIYDEEEVEVSRKNITVKVDETTDKLTGSSVDVTGLDADTTYVVKLIASLDGNQKVLDSETVKTINNGESLEDPIKITSKAQLENMSREPDAYYSLEADLDFGGEELSAIFNSSNKFTGHLEGNNHTISNFKLDVDTTYSGVFGYLKGASISNLNLKEVVFNAERGERYIGALAGYVENSTISNVSVEDVSITYSGQTSKTFMMGGLVGSSVNSKYENCSVKTLNYVIGKARLKGYIGGFIGKNDSSAVTNSSVEGTMSIAIGYTSNSNGIAYIGGFIGFNESAKLVSNSYSKVDMTITEVDEYSGNKTHRAYIGGFIGGNSTTVCKLSDCAAIGNVTVVVKRSYNVFVGGFAGRLTQGSVITNCVYVPGEQFVDDQGNVTADGVMVTLMGPDALGEGEEVTVQKANVGLVIGYVDSNVKLTNVFAYADKFVCNPVASEANQITVNASTVSTDLSGLSDTIKNLIG